MVDYYWLRFGSHSQAIEAETIDWFVGAQVIEVKTIDLLLNKLCESVCRRGSGRGVDDISLLFHLKFNTESLLDQYVRVDC